MSTEPNPEDGASFGPERLAALVEALPVGVFILDGEGTAIYANGAAQFLLGRGIIAGDAAGNLSERFAAYRAGTNEPYPTDEMPIVRALGGQRTKVDDMEVERFGQRVALEVTATPIFDRDGVVAFAVAVFQDITARRIAQRALAELNARLEDEVTRRTVELLRAKMDAEAASRAKSLFLMNVSHELRTPLNHIIGFNELLAERAGDERARKMAETAGASGRDLLDKVNDLIELARAEAEPASATRRVMDLDAAVADAAMRAGVHCETEQPLGSAACDDAAIRRILGDCFERAQGAAIRARVDRDRDARHLVVRITGDELVSRVRALAAALGETDEGAEGRYRQQPVDFRIAVARTQARAIGGDIAVVEAEDGAAVEVRLPVADA